MAKRDHFLVPPHKIMSKEQVDVLLKKMNLGVSNLPKIFVTDPQAKKLNAKPGDVIEIERTDSGKRNSYYRLVVPES